MADVLEVARSQLGVEEVPRGSNDGKQVRQYLASVGIGFPASWCMAFVYWCAGQAGAAGALVKTGGVLRQWNERPQLRAATPAPGDIFILDYGKGLGHTGFVEAVDGDTIVTIEGNTNADGSREGYAVCRRRRSISKCKGFLRLKPAAGAAQPGAK
ncbi:CHAP domain-containing protein [Chromobacterium vaccinii]|uniref:CHAP domain-containing protein n=1 Tax=Chromobacterium vaccinii TaxID=1108595 RepID=UPI0031DCE69A